MKKCDVKEFVTANLYLSSAISIILNKDPLYKVENNQTLFIYPFDNQLAEAINQYYSGIPLNAFEYSQKIKKLRAEMIMRRSINK